LNHGGKSNEPVSLAIEKRIPANEQPASFLLCKRRERSVEVVLRAGPNDGELMSERLHRRLELLYPRL
jgi:hypothetical protein